MKAAGLAFGDSLSPSPYFEWVPLECVNYTLIFALAKSKVPVLLDDRAKIDKEMGFFRFLWDERLVVIKLQKKLPGCGSSLR
jgi:hypothetical protein